MFLRRPSMLIIMRVTAGLAVQQHLQAALFPSPTHPGPNLSQTLASAFSFTLLVPFH